MELGKNIFKIIGGFVLVVSIIGIAFDFMGQLDNTSQITGLGILLIAMFCGASLLMVIVKWLARKIKEGELMKFYLSCYAGLLKNPYFYLVEIMAFIAVWDKAWMLALMYGLAFPFIAANAIFLGNKLKK